MKELSIEKLLKTFDQYQQGKFLNDCNQKPSLKTNKALKQKIEKAIIKIENYLMILEKDMALKDNIEKQEYSKEFKKLYPKLKT